MTNKLEPALFAAYMAILVWAPLPFASNRIWGGANGRGAQTRMAM